MGKLYFIPRSSRMYAVLISASPLSWYAMTVAGCLIVSIIWLLVIDRPARQHLISAQQEYHDVMQRHQTVEQLEREIRALETEVQRLELTMRQATSSSNKAGLHQIIATSAQAGLALVSCTPRLLHHTDWCIEHPVTGVYSGTFKQVQQYLRQLTLLDIPLTMNRIALERGTKDILAVTLDCTVMEMHEQHKA